MAKRTKTKLNKKLGKPSSGYFYNADKKRQHSTIYTNESGGFSTALSFKQPRGAANGFQVQYRWRHRYTPSVAKKKGASYTGWSNWADGTASDNAIASRKATKKSLEDAYAAAAKKYNDNKTAANKKSRDAAKEKLDNYKLKYGTNPDYWHYVNRAYDKSKTINIFRKLTDKKVSGDYDARQYQIRVRTYNSSKKTHGEFYNGGTLGIYKAAVISNEVMHRTVSGGVIIDANMKWERSGILHFDSLKDADGRELLKAKFTKAWTYDSKRTSASNPPLRSGYTPVECELPLSSLKRAVECGEEVTANIYFQTSDGAKTALSISSISKEDVNINQPRLEVTKDDASGVVFLRIYKTDAADAVQYVSAACTYTYNDKKYTITPYYQKDNLSVRDETTVISEMRFRPPFGLECRYSVTVSNDYKSTRSVSGLQTINSERFTLTSTSELGVIGTLWGNVSLSLQTSRETETAVPYGRKSPVAFFGDGVENTITLKGTIIDQLDVKASSTLKLPAWTKIRTTLGMFLLRCPNGEMYKVALTDVSISAEFEGYREVSCSMVEVS